MLCSSLAWPKSTLLSPAPSFPVGPLGHSFLTKQTLLPSVSFLSDPPTSCLNWNGALTEDPPFPLWLIHPSPAQLTFNSRLLMSPWLRFLGPYSWTGPWLSPSEYFDIVNSDDSQPPTSIQGCSFAPSSHQPCPSLTSHPPVTHCSPPSSVQPALPLTCPVPALWPYCGPTFSQPKCIIVGKKWGFG